jgi:predicted transcriptional regulator
MFAKAQSMINQQAVDSINLALLEAIGNKEGITTRELEGIVFLSKSQTLRRLRRLEQRGLILKRGGSPGRPYHYMLDPSIAPSDIEQFNQVRFTQCHDLAARESLAVISQGIQAISDQLAQMVRRINNILE